MCVLCPVGKFKLNTSSFHHCEDCAENTFAAGRGAWACEKCPRHTTSEPGSAVCRPDDCVQDDEVSGCLCSAGSTGAVGGPCTACAVGTFKTSAGPAACVPCARNETSGSGSTACVCAENYFGVSGACAACREGLVSPQNSSQCFCPAGQFLRNGVCVALYPESLHLTGALTGSGNMSTSELDDLIAAFVRELQRLTSARLIQVETFIETVERAALEVTTTTAAEETTTPAEETTTPAPAEETTTPAEDVSTPAPVRRLLSVASGTRRRALLELVTNVQISALLFFGSESTLDAAAAKLSNFSTPLLSEVAVERVAGQLVNGVFAGCAERMQVVNGSCACVAGYQERAGACESCKVGTYKALAGAGDCAECAGNTYSLAASTNCTECPLGSDTIDGHTRCVCRVGFVLFKSACVEAEPSYVTVDARLRYNSSSFAVADARATLVAAVSTKFDIEPSMLVVVVSASFEVVYVEAPTTTAAPTTSTTPAPTTSTTPAPTTSTTPSTTAEETSTPAPVEETSTPAPVEETTPAEETSTPAPTTSTTPAPTTSTTPSTTAEETSTPAPVEETSTPAPVEETTPAEETSTPAPAQVIPNVNVTCSGVCLCEPSNGMTSGIISDGERGYKPDSDCKWTISASGGIINLWFLSFSTEYQYDYVTVKSCSDPSCTSSQYIAKFSGPNVDGGIFGSLQSNGQLSNLIMEDVANTFTSTTGYMLVEFTSDEGVEELGFRASWSITFPNVSNAPATSTVAEETTSAGETSTPAPAEETTSASTTTTTPEATTTTTPEATTTTTPAATTTTMPAATTTPPPPPAAGTSATVTCSGDRLCQPSADRVCRRCEGVSCQPSSGTSSGVISDGPGDYTNYANCYWTIASDGPIYLWFTSFNTQTDLDYVVVSTCNDLGCTRMTTLVRLSGSEPSNINGFFEDASGLFQPLNSSIQLSKTIFTSSTGYMKVQFSSDSSDERAGFSASWSNTFPDDSITPAATTTTTPAATTTPAPPPAECTGSGNVRCGRNAKVACQPSNGISYAVISDGDGPYQYVAPYQRWAWDIESSDIISLSFTSFDTTKKTDYVEVNDCSDQSSDNIARNNCPYIRLSGSISNGLWGSNQSITPNIDGIVAPLHALGADALTYKANGYMQVWFLVGPYSGGGDGFTASICFIKRNTTTTTTTSTPVTAVETTPVQQTSTPAPEDETTSALLLWYRFELPNPAANSGRAGSFPLVESTNGPDPLTSPNAVRGNTSHIMSYNEYRTSFMSYKIPADFLAGQMTCTFWFFIPYASQLNTILEGPYNNQRGLQLLLFQSALDGVGFQGIWTLRVYNNSFHFHLTNGKPTWNGGSEWISDVDFDLRTLDDSWNHFAVVLTHASFEFYVNGARVHVLNSDMGGILQGMMNNAQWRFIIGGAGGDWKESLIDDVRLYSKKLSALQITDASTSEPALVTETTPAEETSTPAPFSNTSATVTCSGGCLCEPSSGTSSGVISDGPGDYTNNAVCTWTIASGGTINLVFTAFQTEIGRDYVFLDSCTDQSCTSSTIIEQLSGTDPVTGYTSAYTSISGLHTSGKLTGTTYTSTTGYMRVKFTSDHTVPYDGFTASWSITNMATPAATTTTPAATTTTPAATTSTPAATTTTPVATTTTTPAATTTTPVATTTTTPAATTTTTPAATTITTPVTGPIAGNVTCRTWWSGRGGCSCNPSTGTTSGSISDGDDGVSPEPVGGWFGYSNNADCTWTIASSDIISLSFSRFETEKYKDFVTVKSCTDQSCTSSTNIASVSGSYDQGFWGLKSDGDIGALDFNKKVYELTTGYETTLTNVYTSTTGYMLVEFKADLSHKYNGFRAAWSVARAPGRRLLAVDYFGPDEEPTPDSTAAPPTSTRALPVTTTPDPRVVDYYVRRVSVTCSCPLGSALCAKCVPLQEERFAVGDLQFYGQKGSAVIVAGYVNYAGVPTVCADGEEFRTDVLTMSKVCVEKSAVAESSILVIILVVVLVFVLLLIAFAARFRHRIYVLLMPRADAGVMDWKNGTPRETEPAWYPPAVPAVDLSQQAHVMYKLQFNK